VPRQEKERKKKESKLSSSLYLHAEIRRDLKKEEENSNFLMFNRKTVNKLNEDKCWLSASGLVVY